jgi:hypothetical protein
MDGVTPGAVVVPFRSAAASSSRPIARRTLHRAVFVAAGVYNISWGLTTALYPQWLYRLTGGATNDRVEMAAALGLVIGLYGVLYLEVARVPERGALIAAVGLAGKVIGPVGLIVLVARGTWPASSLLISATNDFIWWIPFALYLHDCWESPGTSPYA